MSLPLSCRSAAAAHVLAELAELAGAERQVASVAIRRALPPVGVTRQQRVAARAAALDAVAALRRGEQPPGTPGQSRGWGDHDGDCDAADCLCGWAAEDYEGDWCPACGRHLVEEQGT